MSPILALRGLRHPTAARLRAHKAAQLLGTAGLALASRTRDHLTYDAAVGMSYGDRELSVLLDQEEADVLRILPAVAGEVLSEGDPDAIRDLKDALSAAALSGERHGDAVEAVLAMVRTYDLKQRMRRVVPGSAPRRSNDPDHQNAPGH